MFSSENNCGVNCTEQLRGGGAANQEPDSPKRWELSSKERNHPSADRAAVSSSFQVTQDAPSPPPLAPHRAPGALCAPICPPVRWHRCPSWGQVLSSPSCALSPPCTVLACWHTVHKHSHLAPPSALCTPSHLAQGSHTFHSPTPHTSHDLIPRGCSLWSAHAPPVCSFFPDSLPGAAKITFTCVWR